MTQAEKIKKKGTVSRLLDFAGDRKGLTYVGCVLSAVAMAINMVPYVCIWLVVRDLVAVAPNWKEAHSIAGYGWDAFGFAVLGIVVYFCALMCTHLAAFRTATNIRKRCMAHLAKAPLGYFDTHASGLLRRRIDGAAAQTETLLAHNLAAKQRVDARWNCHASPIPTVYSLIYPIIYPIMIEKIRAAYWESSSAGWCPGTSRS